MNADTANLDAKAPATTCKLCGRQTSKFAGSHIHPKFMLREIWDRRNRYTAIQFVGDDAELKEVEHGQAGEKDWRLLCPECEKIPGPWEDYGKRFFFGGEGSNAPFPVPRKYELVGQRGKRTHVVERQETDYKKLKLFFLAWLWRAHTSGQPPYVHINIGHHADIVGGMIRKGDPGPTTRYPVQLMYFNPDSPVPQQILDINVVPWGDQQAVRFIFCEFAAVLGLADGPLPGVPERFLLREDGACHLIEWDFMSIEPVVRIAAKMLRK